MSVASRRVRESHTQPGSSPTASATSLVPQQLELSLSDDAQAALSQVLQNHAKSTKLSKHLSFAIKQITETTGDINENGYEKRLRYSKASARRRANDEDSDEEERAAHDAFQEKVQTLTKQMDMSIRSAVDNQILLEDFPPIVRAVLAAGQEQSTQQQERDDQSPTPIHSTRQTQTERRGGNSQSQSNQGDESLDHNTTDFPGTARSQSAATPHSVLQSQLRQQSRDWQSKTLTERYTPNNNYKGWKRVLYDANNPGEAAPPMPDDSLWFAVEEGRARELVSQHTSHSAEDGDSGSDVEISRETVRLICPITLLPYQNPVTSANCKHSYEQDAILDMLRTSSDHIPFDSQQEADINQFRKQGEREKRRRELASRQEKQVKCPECNVPLRKADLQPNPALQRRVQKQLAAKERAEAATSDVEASDDDTDDIGRGTQRRPVGVGSSPPNSTRQSLMSIKLEKSRSMVPQTQFSNVGTPGNDMASRSRLVDIDMQDDDDDDDEEDDDGE